jgi:hypothetical protein
MSTTRQPSRTPSQSRKSRASGSHSRKPSDSRKSRKSSKLSGDQGTSPNWAARSANSVKNFYKRNQTSANVAGAVAALAIGFASGKYMGNNGAFAKGRGVGRTEGVEAHSKFMHNTVQELINNDIVPSEDLIALHSPEFSANNDTSQWNISPHGVDKWSTILRENRGFLPDVSDY